MSYEIGSTVLNDYKINKLLGQGSYGKVFEIERVDFGVSYKYALKVVSIPSNSSEIESLRMEGMSDEEIRTYFSSIVEDLTKEFSIMYKLKGNSNIVNYDYHKVIEHDDHIGFDVLIQMELLTPVLTYAHSNPFTIKDVIKLGIDISKALEICTKFNIIHRDIKPENIFISELGDFKLGDFGVARSMEKTTTILSKKGTYSYMAPEAYKGEKYNYSVDIYSLGIVLYRLLNNNRTPFLPEYPKPITFKNREESLVKRMSGEPLNPPSFGSDRLKAIILKACAYKPEDRYDSPSNLRRDLEEVLYTDNESLVIYPSGDEISLHTNQYVSTSITTNTTTDTININNTNNKTLNQEDEDKTQVVFNNKQQGYDEDKTEIVLPGSNKVNNTASTSQAYKNKELSSTPLVVCTVMLIIFMLLFNGFYYYLTYYKEYTYSELVNVPAEQLGFNFSLSVPYTYDIDGNLYVYRNIYKKETTSDGYVSNLKASYNIGYFRVISKDSLPYSLDTDTCVKSNETLGEFNIVYLVTNPGSDVCAILVTNDSINYYIEFAYIYSFDKMDSNSSTTSLVIDSYDVKQIIRSISIK